MDSRLLESHKDRLQKDGDKIHHESMELTLLEAVEMVDAIGGLDDVSMHDEKHQCPRPQPDDDDVDLIHDEFNEAAEMVDAKGGLDNKKVRTPTSVESKQKTRERRRLATEERKSDPIAYTDYTRKATERQRKKSTKTRNDPVAHADFTRMKYKRRKVLLAEKMARAKMAS